MFPCNVGWTWCPLHTLKGWYHLQLFTISGIAPCTVWVLLRLFKKEKKRNFPDGLTCSSFTVQLDLQSSELYGSEGGWWREKSRQTLQSWLIVLRSFTSRIYFQKSLHINARVGANPALVIGGQSAGKEKKKKHIWVRVIHARARSPQTLSRDGGLSDAGSHELLCILRTSDDRRSHERPRAYSGVG